MGEAANGAENDDGAGGSGGSGGSDFGGGSGGDWWRRGDGRGGPGEVFCDAGLSVRGHFMRLARREQAAMERRDVSRCSCSLASLVSIHPGGVGVPSVPSSLF